MADADVITAVWNTVKDVVPLMNASQSVAMGQRAFVAPHGKQPMDLDWADQATQRIGQAWQFTSTATEWGLSSGSSIRIGVSWDYGGRLNGQGRFLHEAYLYAVADTIGAGQRFDVTGSFSEHPVLVRNQVAELPGRITIQHYFALMHHGTYDYDVRIRGDGSGEITPI